MGQRNAVISIATTILLSLSNHTLAQDMMGLDITSDAFTKSETTRAAIEADLAKLPEGQVLDLSGKSLNGLDFSGIDFRRMNCSLLASTKPVSEEPTWKALCWTKHGL